MFERFKLWRQKRKDLKEIEKAFQLARRFYPHASQDMRIALRDTLRDLVDEYHINWGGDKYTRLYYMNLNDFVAVYHHQDKKRVY